MGHTDVDLDLNTQQRSKQTSDSTGLFGRATLRGAMRKRSADSIKIVPSDITPYEQYLSRRALLAGGLGLAAAHSIGGFAPKAFGQSAAPISMRC